MSGMEYWRSLEARPPARRIERVTPTDPTDLATLYGCVNVSQNGPRQGSGAVLLVGAERGHTWIAESIPSCMFGTGWVAAAVGLSGASGGDQVAVINVARAVKAGQIGRPDRQPHGNAP